MLVTLPATRRDQRIVAVIHWGNFHSLFESGIMSATARRLVDRVGKFVFLSQGLSNQCAPAIPEEKRVVIPNTIDDATVLPEKDVAAKRRERAERDKLNVLFVGHMMLSKGYLVPPRDPEAIAEALQKLCDMERWTRMSIQARQRFESTFAPERVREKWLGIVG